MEAARGHVAAVAAVVLQPEFPQVRGAPVVPGDVRAEDQRGPGRAIHLADPGNRPRFRPRPGHDLYGRMNDGQGARERHEAVPPRRGVFQFVAVDGGIPSPEIIVGKTLETSFEAGFPQRSQNVVGPVGDAQLHLVARGVQHAVFHAGAAAGPAAVDGHGAEADADFRRDLQARNHRDRRGHDAVGRGGFGGVAGRRRRRGGDPHRGLRRRHAVGCVRGGPVRA